MKRWIPLMAMLFCLKSFGQKADSVLLVAEIERDPNGFAVEEIELLPLQKTAKLLGFSGVRISDVRPDTSCMGYVKLHGDYKKIKVLGGFANAVNAREAALSDKDGSGDSIIIYINFFWMTNNTLVKVETDEEYRDAQRKQVAFFPASCHVSALLFTKNLQGIVYLGKFDSVITSNKVLRKCYTYLPNKAMDEVFGKIPDLVKNRTTTYTAEQVLATLQNQYGLKDALGMQDGIFVSYNDFKKGRVMQRNFKLSPRLGGYKIDFAYEPDGAFFYDKCWGICYKNRFYIKKDFLVTPLHKSGSTYITIAGSVNYDENVSPRSNFDAAFKSSKYDKYSYRFPPLLLNPFTGYLE
jgi:hypothetical protein